MSLLRILLPAYPMIPSPMWILSTMIPSPIVTVFVTGCNAFVTPRNGGITPRVACNGFLWVSARERCLRATPALLALLKIVPLMLGPSLPNWQVGTNDGIVPLMLGAVNRHTIGHVMRFWGCWGHWGTKDTQRYTRI